MVRVYEYAELKTALAMAKDPASAGKKPSFVDIGRFGTINFGAWPDINEMIRGTEYEAVLKKAGDEKADGTDGGESSGIAKETALDRHYYIRLWNALFKLRPADRRISEKIIREEIALRNASWVLRLRTYYGMKAEEVKAQLIEIPGHREMTADALEALERPLDSYRDWENWKRADLLNGEGAGPWKADPRFFQNAASEKLYRLALKNFHRAPMSLDTVFCFIKLKQFEEDLLTSDAEGLGLGMSGRDVFELLEVNA
jgi:vacuolar-type H+-ATPase subunit C/Vma6